MINFESRWIRKIQHNNDPISANKLIKKYYDPIFRFVYKQMLDEQLSLDLTQEIFIRVLHSITSFDDNKSSFQTWLYRIATNHCIDYFRSKQYKSTTWIDLVDEIEVEGTSDVELILEFEEQFSAIKHLLAKLPEQIQQIVRYKIYLNYTFAEISSIIHMPESTVKTNYYKAVKQLRKGMEAFNDGKEKI